MSEDERLTEAMEDAQAHTAACVDALRKADAALKRTIDAERAADKALLTQPAERATQAEPRGMRDPHNPSEIDPLAEADQAADRIIAAAQAVRDSSKRQEL